MSWQTLGAVTPIERKWLDFQPTTQAPYSPTESLAYRITGLNVQTFDPDKFYALLRFKHGADFHPRGLIMPNGESKLVEVAIPAEITTFPFSWVPQVRLIYTLDKWKTVPVNWTIRIDEFVDPDPQSIALANLSKFLY